jgi:hypothetical protein
MARKKKSGIPSLFVVLGLCLIFVALLQLGNLALLFQQNGPFNNTALTTLFADLPQAKAATEQQAQATALITQPEENSVLTALAEPAFVASATVLPRQPNNPVLGALRGRLTVTVFASHCTSVLADVLAQLNEHNTAISTVIKYVPPQPGAMDAGLLMQLAARQGYFEAYWQELCTTGASTLVEQVKALEDAGMSLSRQRAAMALHLNSILQELNADIALAEENGVHAENVPTVFIDGHKVGTPSLPLEHIGPYIQKKLSEAAY